MKTKVAYFGVFTALALIFSYVETLIPIHLGIPGIKLGLANLIVLLVLFKMGTKEAYILTVVRILLAGFLFGSMFSILYSLAGGLVSLTGMWLLKNIDKFSIVGISMVGGVLHNIGQLVVAGFVLETFGVIYYFPVLFVSGTLTGILIGFIAGEMLKRLHKI